MSLSMYQEHILDHSKHPRNAGVLDPADAHARAVNPLCGDELEFFLNFDQAGNVREVKFTGRGCTISQAAASMLTERLIGMSRDDVAKLPTDSTVKLLGVPIAAARLKCATLPLEAAQRAVGHHSSSTPHPQVSPKASPS